MSLLGCIFDCDGTLIDSIGGWRSVEHEFARMCGSELTPEDVEQLCTFTLQETGVFYHTKFGLGKSPEHVVEMADEILVNFYATQVTIRPGVHAFVEGLAPAGIPLCIASSSPHRYLEPGLARVDLAEYFPIVLSTDDVGAPKRQPVIYQRGAQLLGTPVASTWGFEDSIYAVHTLINAGFKCAGCYDRDDSGTLEELLEASTLLIESFDQITAEQFLEIARA